MIGTVHTFRWSTNLEGDWLGAIYMGNDPLWIERTPGPIYYVKTTVTVGRGRRETTPTHR